MFRKIIEKIYLNYNGNLAYYDTLTGLHNRTFYDIEAKKYFHGKRCSVIFIDINGLKKVNDVFGHDAGNVLIKDTAAMIYKIVEFNGVCIRYGGDEFLVILKENNCFDIKKLLSIDSISYGVYDKEVYEDLSSAVAKADREMYFMKNRSDTGRELLLFNERYSISQ